MEILSLIILTLTLGAILWYTIVTHRMQKAVVEQVRELVHQRQLSNMPAFVAEIKHDAGQDYLDLTNIGKGVAINVTIDNVVIRYPSSPSSQIEFERTLRIEAGTTAAIKSRSFGLGSATDGDPNTLTFLGVHAHYDADVTIRFQDMEGTKYLQTVQMGKNGYTHGFVRPDKSHHQPD